MKLSISTLFTFGLSLSISTADPLPTLNVKDWYSYHSLNKGKYHAMAIAVDGSIDLFFVERGARTNLTRPVELKLVIERRTKSASGKLGKWVTKKVRREGFIKPPTPTEQPNTVSLHGTITGDVEFKVDFKFSKDGVLMKGAFVAEPKDAATAEYRLSLVSDVKDLMHVSEAAADDIKKIKSKSRGHEIRLQSRKEKPSKIRFYEIIDTDKLENSELTQVMLKADRLGRKDLYWSLADPKQGTLRLEAKADNKMPYDGLKIITVLIDESGKKLSEGILLEYK